MAKVFRCSANFIPSMVPKILGSSCRLRVLIVQNLIRVACHIGFLFRSIEKLFLVVQDCRLSFLQSHITRQLFKALYNGRCCSVSTYLVSVIVIICRSIIMLVGGTKGGIKPILSDNVKKLQFYKPVLVNAFDFFCVILGHGTNQSCS